MRQKQIQITEHIIRTKKLPQPLRFAFVSDLHLYPNQPVIDAIQSIQPDAVLVGGDFIQSKTDTFTGLCFLSAISKKWPVYCSTGKEHDFDDGLIRQIEDTGAIFLRNRYINYNGLFIGGQNTLQLCGKSQQEKDALITQNRTWLKQYSALPGFKILLCHHPEYYDLFVRDYNIDLILAGHAHGGQIRFFNQGLWAPGQGWFPRYTSGLYDNRLLIGRGIGNTHKIPRVNNRPELLDIRILQT